jgi:predicted CxxxxCH...CXXCH cytochrome family protein
VGAHQAHLVGTGKGLVVACAECHTVPSTTYAAGHLDTERPAEVVFNGNLADLPTPGVIPNPTYSTTSLNCSNTYCHGSFRNGNASNAPTWNGAAGTGAECGTCHGTTSGGTLAEKALPKTAAGGGTHPPYSRCETCHTSVNASLAFTNSNKHVDGLVELFQLTSQAECSRCHGSVANAAPPNDLTGSASSPAVGAHQAHLVAANSVSVRCQECHTVPNTLVYTGVDGHIDGTIGAEILFNDSLARKTTSSGTIVPVPTYTASTLTCSSTYCHGTFKNGNQSNAPVWNVASTAACGTCHGDPVTGNPTPGGNHPTNNNCNFCHTVNGETAVAMFDGVSTWTITNKPKHLNGKLNLFAAENDF